MRLSWNEIRARAAAFAKEWRNAAYEKGETHSFYNDFFDIFGVKRRTVARYEEHVKRLDNSSSYIDLFWSGVLLVEHKSAGRKLTRAYGQARDYFDALPERERPRYILVSDFQTFELHDLDERGMTAFALADLPHHVEKFGFILGVQKRTFKDQDPVNIQASELMGRLHDALKESGYARPEPGRRAGHDLELFLVQTVFCLFADDTGIFEPRALEVEVLKEPRAYRADTETGELDAAALSVVNVDQFYGIEINPFPTRIAETALWMMDHIMNNRSLTLDTFSRRGGAGGASLNAVSSEGQAVYKLNREREFREEFSS